jgi:hypothetical protein
LLVSFEESLIAACALKLIAAIAVRAELVARPAVSILIHPVALRTNIS